MATDQASFVQVVPLELDCTRSVHPVEYASSICLKLRLSCVAPRVFIAGVTRRVVAGFRFWYVDFISYAVPPALAVFETVHISVAPPVPCFVQQTGRVEVAKFSLKGSE